MKTNIDYKKVGEAIDFYEGKGFQYIEVPWITAPEPYAITSPPGVTHFDTFLGKVVASGEQSFLDLILKKELKEGKYLAATPCFRDEKNPDEYHHKWFFKLELIDFLGYKPLSGQDLRERDDFVLNSAIDFFKRYLPITVVPTDIGKDIFAKDENIELGSYGVRSYDDFSWVYGTAIAEPRLSHVLSKKLKGYHIDDIPRGENSTPSKIYEELNEFKDALKQKNKIMAVLELADLIGSIELYLESEFNNSITLDDLLKMKDVTKRAFENGAR